MNKILIIAFSVVSLGLCQCKKDIATSECSTKNNALFEKYHFKIGTCVEPYKLIINDYESLVQSQFNSITAENVMKASYIHPAEDVYSWQEADELAEYCEQNRKRFHGHTLIWDQQLPNWILQFQGDRKAWEALMQEHIQTIVGHFKGKVDGWDVVNEAFNDDGTLKNTIWKQHLGPEYIEQAFRYAAEADPNAKLFYNDYSLALKPIKRKAVLDFFIKLKAKGVKVDGIGMQMHIFIQFPEFVDIEKSMSDVIRSGFLLHISELDISLNPFSEEEWQASDEMLSRQADRYFNIFKAYDQFPSDLLYGITLWGVSDADSWIPSYYNRVDYPLLFDNNYHPKPAFCKLISEQ